MLRSRASLRSTARLRVSSLGSTLPRASCRAGRSSNSGASPSRARAAGAPLRPKSARRAPHRLRGFAPGQGIDLDSPLVKRLPPGALTPSIESMFQLRMEFDLDHLSPEDRREVNPPVPVESATWSAGGTLDWSVRERREWLGRVRGPNGRQSGSKPLIFVRPRRHDRWRSRNPDTRRRTDCAPLRH